MIPLEQRAHFYTWSDDHVCALCEAQPGHLNVRAVLRRCCSVQGAAPLRRLRVYPPAACALLRLSFRSKDIEILVLFFETGLSCHLPVFSEIQHNYDREDDEASAARQALFASQIQSEGVITMLPTRYKTPLFAAPLSRHGGHLKTRSQRRKIAKMTPGIYRNLPGTPNLNYRMQRSNNAAYEQETAGGMVFLPQPP